MDVIALNLEQLGIPGDTVKCCGLLCHVFFSLRTISIHNIESIPIVPSQFVIQRYVTLNLDTFGMKTFGEDIYPVFHGLQRVLHAVTMGMGGNTWDPFY